MISIVKLSRGDKELGFFLKTKEGYLKINEEIEYLEDINEEQFSLEYHSGKIIKEEGLDSYIG